MTPRRSAVWFAQLASLTRAGITIPASVREARGPSPAEREALAVRLENGEDALTAWPKTPFLMHADAVVLAAGQLSGKFPDVCAELALRNEATGALRSKMLLALMYPVFLLSTAIFMLPLLASLDFTGKTDRPIGVTIERGLTGGIILLGLFWAAIFGLREFAKRKPELRFNFVRMLPIWSGAAKQTSYSIFAGTLASLLRAGVGIGNAWTLAAEAANDGAIIRLATKVRETVDTHRAPPGPVIAKTSVFPEGFRSLYLAGEASGSLEARLDELRVRHGEDAAARAQVAAFAYTKLLLIVAMVFVAWIIISKYAAYFGSITDMAKGM